MPRRKQLMWYERELYELLCLLLTAECLWLVGRQLDLFSAMGEFAARNRLMDYVMLGFCMSFGLYAAALRKSHKLRQAVASRDAAQTEAEAVARHDAMTGLANRRFFKELLAARLSHPSHAVSTAVLLIDLDRFKTVNDAHGHAAGDTVLCTMADRLRSLLPPNSVAARLGGDEFASIVDFGADVESLGRLCKALVVEMGRPVACGQGKVQVGTTIGVAIRSEDQADPDALLHAADIAMYEGKKDGRGTFRFFLKEMDQSLKARALLEHELRVGIESGQIEPFFQPLVSLVDEQLIGFEILARWRHPSRGLLLPDVFITVAEETGMIADLCWSVLRQACLGARSWAPHLQLAINIAPQQLRDPRMSERIMSILSETGFSPTRLEVEITETALIEDLDAARAALKALRGLGIRIALDDFGTGYSSLYHLRELKFDKLKIDRSYVSLGKDDERSKLVNAMINIGTSLGMVTTAEGIESVGNMDWLAGQGCTYGQGYFFGKPMAKDAVDAWVRRKAAAEPLSPPCAVAA